MDTKTVRFPLVLLATVVVLLSACVGDTGNIDPDNLQKSDLVSLTISHLPNKFQYGIGEVSDWTGLEITGIYANGSTAVEVLSGVTISGFDSTSAGVKTITVSKDEKTAIFAVTVTPQPDTVVLMGLTVSSLPAKLVYALNEVADWTDLEITGIYTDGSTAVEPISDVTISGFDSTVAGTKTISVSKDGKTAVFAVTVNPVVTLAALTISQLPAKLLYAVGETAVWTGLELKGIYTDGNAVVEDLSGVTISGFDSATTGTKTISVSKDSQSVSFAVTVTGKGTGGITVVPLPDGNIGIIITDETLNTLEASAGYTEYHWQVDGIGRDPDSPDGRTITLDPMIYGVGKHRVLILAYKNGVPYSGELTITL